MTLTFTVVCWQALASAAPFQVDLRDLALKVEPATAFIARCGCGVCVCVLTLECSGV